MKKQDKKYKGVKDLSGYYFNQVRQGALKRSLEFKITIEQMLELFEKQDSRCAFTNTILVLDRHYGRNRKGNSEQKSTQTASLDRIDSTKGYTIDNVQWIHKDINKMKMDMNNNKFVELCKLIANKTSKSRIRVSSYCEVEGIHRWLGCPIEEVAYLRDYHRHIFKIRAFNYVTHSDRDIEFVQQSHKIKEYLTRNYYSEQYRCLFFGDKSCEMIAEELIAKFNLSECEVTEDGEGGAFVTNY